MKTGVAQLNIDFDTDLSPELDFLASNKIIGGKSTNQEQFLKSSFLKLGFKLYNGPYIDDWLLMNFTLSGEHLIEAIQVIDDEMIVEDVMATLSFGKFFDVLVVYPKCKIDQLIIKKNY